MVNYLDHLPTDIKAFIYQNTNDLEKDLIPGSQLAVVMTTSPETSKYQVKFTLKTNDFAVDAVGTATDPFEAVKEAKEKMSKFLGDVTQEMNQFRKIEKPLVLH